MSYNVPRWLRLYDYSKKLNLSREKKTIEKNNLNLQTEQQECTFHPNTHYTSFYKENQLNTNEINNSLIERYNKWNKKKMNKIKRIFIQKRNNQEKIYTYKPNIKRDNRYFTNVNKLTENIVNDPESYIEYIQRQEKIRNEKKNLEKKRNNTPGNGNIYNGKRTIIKEFNLETSKLNLNKCPSYSNIIRYRNNNNYIFNSNLNSILNSNFNSNVSSSENMKFIIIKTGNNSSKKTSSSSKKKIFSNSSKSSIRNKIVKNNDSNVSFNNINSRNKKNNIKRFISKNEEEKNVNINDEFNKIKMRLHKELLSFDI